MRNILLVLFLALAGCGSATSDPDSSESAGNDTSGSDSSDGEARVPPEEGGVCPAGGAAPVEGPDGLPQDCAVLFEGCCYANGSDACRAAGCGDECTVADSYPSQLGRCD